jgi:mutual gliding-motility protein MglA
MVFFNYATMQMAAKIVYYGPGLCGKTTNLHHIYAKTSPQSRGEMVSLETETDRTLFFDLLPIDVGVIGGFKTRLQLYTIPGQVFYNTTRKLVLKGVDGLVFVADSQVPMLEPNLESFKNLRENLGEIGLTLEDIPLVMQLNKRDLPNINPPETIMAALDPENKYEYVEAVAASGTGVFETLKLISKLTLRTLRRRMTGDEPVKPAPRKLADVTHFRVQSEPSITARPAAIPPSPSTNAVGSVSSPGSSFGGAAAAETSPGGISTIAQELATVVEEIEDEIAAADDIVNAAPEPPPAPPQVQALPPSPPPAKDEPPVKTVKVRSSIDVMAELEALRKRATQAPPKAKKEPVPAEPRPTPGRDIQKALSLSVPADALERARSLKVTLSFEGGDGAVVHTREEHLDLGDDGTDVRSVSVNLKIDPA